MQGEAVQNFYRAAFVGLVGLELHVPRRFGDNRDAEWKLFKGELKDRDRLDLLIRDAAADHPAGFAPRVVFGIEGLAADEPFGADWAGADPTLAAELFRSQRAGKFPLKTTEDVLAEAAKAWGLAATKTPAVPSPIKPATRVVAAGAGAVMALARAFAGRQDEGLRLGDQVLVVTDSPAERQLHGLAVALCDRREKPTVRLVSSSAELPKDFPDARFVVISADAESAASDAARRIAKELGAS